MTRQLIRHSRTLTLRAVLCFIIAQVRVGNRQLVASLYEARSLSLSLFFSLAVSLVETHVVSSQPSRGTIAGRSASNRSRNSRRRRRSNSSSSRTRSRSRRRSSSRKRNIGGQQCKIPTHIMLHLGPSDAATSPVAPATVHLRSRGQGSWHSAFPVLFPRLLVCS